MSDYTRLKDMVKDLDAIVEEYGKLNVGDKTTSTLERLALKSGRIQRFAKKIIKNEET